MLVFARGTRVSKHDIIQPHQHHQHPSPPPPRSRNEKKYWDPVYSSYKRQALVILLPFFFLIPTTFSSTSTYSLSWLSLKKIKRSATLIWRPYLKQAAIIPNTVTIWILLKKKNLSRSAWCVNSIIVSCFGRKSLYTCHLKNKKTHRKWLI